MADTQLTSALAFLPKDKALYLGQLLSHPEAVLTFKIPFRLDSGLLTVVDAYRVQYNSTRGPYKGGMRFHPQVTLPEVTSLAFWMTIKNALAGLPFGGGKGGVVVNPKLLSSAELERLTRSLGKILSPHIGPYQDIPAPDMGTDATTMRWLTEEFQKTNRSKKWGYSKRELLATYTGKPFEFGGSRGRTEATGLGGLIVLDNLVRLFKLEHNRTAPLTVAIQGFGNVGYNLALLLSKNGYLVTAISDSSGGLYNSQGIQPNVFARLKKQYTDFKTIPSPDAAFISNAQLLELPVDILIPAALQNQITPQNAPRIQAKVILEMANGPTHPDADHILLKRNILVIPDVLANSGGVIVSFLEWLQNLSGRHWTLNKINQKLLTRLTNSCTRIYRLSKKHHITLRTAAFLSALNKIG